MQASKPSLTLSQRQFDQFCPKKGPHRLFAKKLQSTGEYKELYLLKLISISIGVSDFISLLEIIAAVKRRQINEIWSFGLWYT